jgi:prevent-host-death family protein
LPFSASVWYNGHTNVHVLREEAISMNISPATVVRENFRQTLQRTEKEPVIVTQFGRPKAVLLSFDLYERMLAALEDLHDEHDPELARAVEEAGVAHARGETIPLEEALAHYGL